MNKRFCAIWLVFVVLSAAGCSGGAGNAAQTEPAEASLTPNESGTDAAAAWPTDKWSRSAPERQGVDGEQLAKADKRIKENYLNVYSLLVVRHGYLVYENYYHGMNNSSAAPVFSVTKSVMSALTGIAMNEGLLDNTDQKLSGLLPDMFAGMDDNRKGDITLRDVLTMSGGLESIDSDYNAYFTSGDWLKYALSKPMVHNPGEQFDYNTGLTHFLSGVISAAAKRDTFSYAQEVLFKRIGMKVSNWEHDGKGIYGGGSGLYLKPEDMAKFGYLYLHKGKWNGEQIIPEAWVEESTKKQITVASGVDYGYLFWLETMGAKDGSPGYSTFRADGAGGQKIVVVPELDLVVVVTANQRSTSRDKADTQAIIADYVLPAVK
ncbi:serine hydrolase domain-containing protein [Gorillibacterium massiliense]|uniref:serine hydrolase domain-containing protein n=1 Tax=Gorillibacterium massiliense TaxID=1280390 RepID=UPI0004B02920|nr:serine hydrolase [Gorillibacterium massiliense]